MLWIGRARHLGPKGKPLENEDLATHVGTVVLIIGDWLTYGEAAWNSNSDFLLIAVTRMILARSRNEYAKLRWKK